MGNDEGYWEIQWLVPAKNAIGGKAYWYPLTVDGDGRTKIVTREKLEKCLAIARKNYTPDEIRLARFNITIEPIPESAAS